MRHKVFSIRTLSYVGIVFFLALGAFSQAAPKTRLRDTLEIGRGMSPMTADLIAIGARSNMFLTLTEELQLTPAQRKSLEDIFFQVQQANVHSEADLDVVDAEIRRALSSDSVDMGDIRLRLSRMEKIRGDGQFARLQATLRAVALLTHEQHLKAIMLALQKWSTVPSN